MLILQEQAYKCLFQVCLYWLAVAREDALQMFVSLGYSNMGNIFGRLLNELNQWLKHEIKWIFRIILAAI